jgi:hypothetical protein
MKREYAASTAKLKHGLIIAGLLTVLGLWLMLFAGDAIPDSRLVGGVNLVAALLIAGYSWQSTRRGDTVLTVDDAGIWYREWGATAPWREIADIYGFGARLNPHIALKLRDSERFFAALPGEKAQRLSTSRYYKNGLLLLPNNCAEVAFSELLLTLKEARQKFGEEGAST